MFGRFAATLSAQQVLRREVAKRGMAKQERAGYRRAIAMRPAGGDYRVVEVDQMRAGDRRIAAAAAACATHGLSVSMVMENVGGLQRPIGRCSPMGR